MYAGQIVEQAPTPVLFSEMRMPYTEALLESIPKLDQPSHTQLRAIAGRPPDLINPPKGCRFSPRCPYVQDRCREEAPPLVEAETPGHLYACWYPVGSDVWQEVKTRLAKEGTATIPVSVEAAEPGDVILDAADGEPVADADGAPDEADSSAAAEAAPQETPASSPGGS
jgi:oligopeptide/dipeptide ABC transporter ATP-binding protein